MLLFMFFSTWDYLVSKKMKHLRTDNMVSIMHPVGDLQGEYILRCTCQCQLEITFN